MNTPATQDEAEAIAKKRFLVMGLVRIGALGALLIGLAIARSVLAGPFWLGVALAIGGMVAFFFAPPMLAKRWKAGDRERGA